MEALITTAWRAFWVGLGASAVLIAHSVASPAPVSVPTPQPIPRLEDKRPPSHDAVSESASLPRRQAPVGRLHNAS